MDASQELYDDLDSAIKDVVANNPNSKESIILKQKINEEVKKRLTQS